MFHTTFYLRRLHSLCGLLVLGFFIIEHMITNSVAMAGPTIFNQVMGMVEEIPKPIFYSIEIGMYAIPILFHGIYGIYIALQAKNNPREYGYLRNWNFALQRWTAWFLVVFLIWHVGYLRIYIKGMTGTPISFELLQNMFQNPVVAILYVLGMWAAIFHFCNGITTFCMTWGITKGSRAQNVISIISMGLCALLCLVTVAFMSSYFIY
ncbi:MAG: succinate dehydrogenase [Selenomonadaceae bacterium]|nr:succinate dehydrogenase [Selenomonadaceae bacterium]